MVDVGIITRIRQFLLAPPALLTAAMTVLAVLVNRHRLGLDLAGGRLLPIEGLIETWSAYLASWHPIGGGSAAPPPAALAVIGVLGLPVGSPAVAVSLLLLGALPLAALSAYRATCALPVSRGRRALAAAGYALLPPAIAGVAQGRLDVVLVHLLLPLVLAGSVAVLRGGTVGRSGGWLSTAAGTALGLAVIGAFAPLVHLLVLAVVLVGFVVIPAARVATLRRAVGLFAVVLLPLGLLVPWPAVVIQRPAVLLHGVGAVVPEQVPGWLQLLALNPGGPGAVPWVGALVVIAAMIALCARPSRGMLPGLGLTLLGAVAVVVLVRSPMQPLAGGDPRPGSTAGALLLIGCGLLWIVLLAGRAGISSPEEPTRWWVSDQWNRALSATPWVGVVALAAAAVAIGAGGPLTANPPAGLPALAPSLTAELARSATSILVVGAPGEPVRLTRSRTARFGDDDIVPLRATGARLERVAAALRAGQPGETSAAIANVAASGVQFVVLPTAAQGARALAAAGPLARPAPPTADGRPVLRVTRPVPGAELLGPALAAQARTGASPPIEPGVSGVLAPAAAPRAAVRVAPGAEGRLLVVAANDEPGWRASVNGRGVPVVRGWGHQVAVPVQGNAAEVRVDRSDST
ncbi:MAG: glycosyltransferase, partial [Pseudonocardiaceae bacterium]